MSNKVLLAQPT